LTKEKPLSSRPVLRGKIAPDGDRIALQLAQAGAVAGAPRQPAPVAGQAILDPRNFPFQRRQRRFHAIRQQFGQHRKQSGRVPGALAGLEQGFQVSHRHQFAVPQGNNPVRLDPDPYGNHVFGFLPRIQVDAAKQHQKTQGQIHAARPRFLGQQDTGHRLVEAAGLANPLARALVRMVEMNPQGALRGFPVRNAIPVQWGGGAVAVQRVGAYETVFAVHESLPKNPF
jgi:hypothetical protein